MQLHCHETNLVEYIGNICKLYQFNASQRNITFTFEHDKDHVLAWVDRVQFDKVVSNLLSNAFKYTFDGGEVKVVLREQEKTIEIQVVDNGLGFKGDEADKLFERFYQGSNSASLGMQGTGIGLNLCRAITQMHGGRIKAQNRTDGQQGATFIVTIPKGNAHLQPEQIVSDEPSREVLSKGKTMSGHFFHILIADDDREIANYIIGELGDRYKFDYAPNGKEALKMLLTSDYDLVISDVMMPEMDGLQLLRRIKDNPTISQLPVIMLTSKSEVEYKLEGLKSGADAYIAKPFDMEELHIQIDNLIDSVRRLRGKFSGAVAQEQRVENIEVKGNDEALMERIMKSVNANMSNPAYTVDTMAEDVGISRAQLHRKMKEMTGIATGKFLRNLRMEQAARLLREGKINVAQIADRVGYADQAHFSTAFKSHFGQSPSEYAETHHEE
jgi:DNA-binding response OmpR family regulator/two-component sensor histidine kinase